MIKRGTLCTILGLLLLLAALLLTAYNLRRDAAAGDAAELVLERLTSDLPWQESLSQSPTGEGKEEAFVPDYVLNPELPMPEREIDEFDIECLYRMYRIGRSRRNRNASFDGGAGGILPLRYGHSNPHH